jgi:hypothetical protein
MAATKTFGGGKYLNGQCPPALLAELTPSGKHGTSGTSKAYLRADGAASWNRAIADVERRTGLVLTVRGWNRSLAEQERFFFERYEVRWTGAGPFNDVRWYKLKRYVRVRGASAAIPGRSNHGWALAVDVNDFGGVGEFDNARRRLAFPILAEHGWTDTEGRQEHVNEPWHLVYDPTKDKNRGQAAPTTEEDDMTPEQARQLANVENMVARLAQLAPGMKGRGEQGPLWPSLKRVLDGFPDLLRNAVLLGRLRPGKSGVGEQGDLWPLVQTALSAPAGDAEVDVEQLAQALADALPAKDAEAIAKRTADIIAARMKG